MNKYSVLLVTTVVTILCSSSIVTLVEGWDSCDQCCDKECPQEPCQPDSDVSHCQDCDNCEPCPSIEECQKGCKETPNEGTDVCATFEDSPRDMRIKMTFTNEKCMKLWSNCLDVDVEKLHDGKCKYTKEDGRYIKSPGGTVSAPQLTIPIGGSSKKKGTGGYSNMKGTGGYSNMKGTGGYSNMKGTGGYSKMKGTGGYSNMKGTGGYSNMKGTGAYINIKGMDPSD